MRVELEQLKGKKDVDSQSGKGRDADLLANTVEIILGKRESSKYRDFLEKTKNQKKPR